MTDKLLMTQCALEKAANRWRIGFLRNDQESQPKQQLIKPDEALNYDNLTSRINSLKAPLNSIEARALIEAGIAWGEYQLNDLDQSTRVLVGKE